MNYTPQEIRALFHEGLEPLVAALDDFGREVQRGKDMVSCADCKHFHPQTKSCSLEPGQSCPLSLNQTAANDRR